MGNGLGDNFHQVPQSGKGCPRVCSELVAELGQKPASLEVPIYRAVRQMESPSYDATYLFWGELCHPSPRPKSPAPQNVTIFRDRAIEEVIKLRLILY